MILETFCLCYYYFVPVLKLSQWLMPRFVFFIMGVAVTRARRSEHCSLLNRSNRSKNNLSLPSDILQYPSLLTVIETMQKSTSQVGGTVELFPFFPANGERGNLGSAINQNSILALRSTRPCLLVVPCYKTKMMEGCMNSETELRPSPNLLPFYFAYYGTILVCYPSCF